MLLIYQLHCIIYYKMSENSERVCRASGDVFKNTENYIKQRKATFFVCV